MLLTKFGSISSQSRLMLDGWKYGKKITIPANSIDEDMVNFPCTVYLNGNDIYDYTEDLCIGGTAISGGTYSGSSPINAFDNLSGTYWQSSQVDVGNVINKAYIGYDFVIPKHIRKIKFQYAVSTSAGNPDSIKLQSSDDGAIWVDIQLLTPSKTSTAVQTFEIISSSPKRYWRCLASGNIDNGYYFKVAEIEMMEYQLIIPANFNFSQCKPDGSDIRFTDKNLNFLKFERKEHIPSEYSVDLCTNGTPISSASGASDPPSKAYDNVETTTFWRSATSYSLLSGNAYIGYQFSEPREIRRIRLVPYGSTNSLSSHIIQYSDNGTNWTSVYTWVTSTTVASIVNLDSFGTHSYWRLLANANLTSGYDWRVLEIEMMEPIAYQATYNILIPKVSSLTDTEFYMWFGNENTYNTSIEAWQDQTGKPITYNGNVKLVPNVAKFGKAGYFDGSGDYINIPTISLSGDFTLEAVVYPNVALATNQQLISGSTGAGYSNSNQFCIVNSRLQLYNTLIHQSVLNSKQQYHVAMVRQNGVVRLYVDGIQSTASLTSNVVFTCTTIGAWYLNGAEVFNGYMDELRISDTARWTSSFTPPTEPYTVDEYTKLLIHFDSTPFTDETGKSLTTYGDVKPVKTAYADCARSAYFDGSGDYFTLGGQSDFAFGTGDFCIEINYIPTNLSVAQILYDSTPVSINGEYPRIAISSSKVNYDVNGVTRITGTTVLEVGRLYRISLERVSGITKLRLDDIEQGSSYIDSMNYKNGTLRPIIGAPGYNPASNNLYGYILGVRVTNGRGRYASGSVQSSKFEIDGSDVVFCTNFDTIWDSSYAMVQHMGDTLIDATGNGNNGTATGTTVVSTEFGNARSFNGSSDYIQFPDAFRDTEFTHLLSLGLTSLSAVYRILGYTNISRYYGYELSLGNQIANKFDMTLLGSSGGTLKQVVGIPSNTPYVPCISLNSVSGMTLFNNGIIENTTTYATPIFTTTMYMYLGKHYGTSNYFYSGKIHEYRISRISRSNAWIKAESLALKNNLLTMSNL